MNQKKTNENKITSTSPFNSQIYGEPEDLEELMFIPKVDHLLPTFLRMNKYSNITTLILFILNSVCIILHVIGLFKGVDADIAGAGLLLLLVSNFQILMTLKVVIKIFTTEYQFYVILLGLFISSIAFSTFMYECFEMIKRLNFQYHDDTSMLALVSLSIGGVNQFITLSTFLRRLFVWVEQRLSIVDWFL
ncbi:hypothetical protein QTN25_007371 [Entamoeba marina]